ncbi:hypothetical protein TCAL_16427 [Tigriopus californicus]|uniref:Uncharacterized protein n=1 Tax=Tigriopus californicus TaxID=6832 RepID=A0A553NYF9_TIGCA|nr:hypothetical protein TCAL_16427 [Tigriopus californicus]
MRDIGSIRRAQQANPLLVSAMEPGPNWETRANLLGAKMFENILVSLQQQQQQQQ